MTPEEVGVLVARFGIGEVPGEVVSAILEINNTEAFLDRGNHQAVIAHNNRVIAAHRAVDDWRWAADDEGRLRRRKFQNAVFEWSGPRIPGPNYVKIFPGRVGHTRPINPMVMGTGLPRQGKAPRYDEDGHLV